MLCTLNKVIISFLFIKNDLLTLKYVSIFPRNIDSYFYALLNVNAMTKTLSKFCAKIGTTFFLKMILGIYFTLFKIIVFIKTISQYNCL